MCGARNAHTTPAVVGLLWYAQAMLKPRPKRNLHCLTSAQSWAWFLPNGGSEKGRFVGIATTTGSTVHGGLANDDFAQEVSFVSPLYSFSLADNLAVVADRVCTERDCKAALYSVCRACMNYSRRERVTHHVLNNKRNLFGAGSATGMS